jgi:transposase
MSNITTLGIDLAKPVFQLCGSNQAQKVIFNKQVKRARLLDEIRKHPNAVIAMEACGSAHHWSRTLTEMGFKVRLIPAQHVKALVRGNKNDAADALAIAEAVFRPNIHDVEPKTLEQQDIQLLLRIRTKIKDQRKQNACQRRSLLSEYGVIFPVGLANLDRAVPELLEDAENGLTPIARKALHEQLLTHQTLSKKVNEADKQLAVMASNHDIAKQLMRLRGIGSITAPALYACIGKGRQFKNARQLSAWLGLVPKQYGTGGVIHLGGISKRGNSYLRTLLIHGARTVFNWAKKRDDTLSVWATSVAQRRGKHKAIVAVANKTARMVWVVLHKGVPALPEHYVSAR